LLPWLDFKEEWDDEKNYSEGNLMYLWNSKITSEIFFQTIMVSANESIPRKYLGIFILWGYNIITPA
jgi:hypothetical protein